MVVVSAQKWSGPRKVAESFSTRPAATPELRLLGESQVGIKRRFGEGGGVIDYSADGGAFSFAQLGFQLGGQERVVSPYSENTFVRAAVKAFSNGLNRLELQMWSGDPTSKSSKVVEGNKLMKLLKRPNRRQTMKQFLKGHVTGIKLFGESAWFFANKTGKPVKVTQNGLFAEFPAQIIQVPGNQMQVEKDDDTGWIKNYRYTLAGGSSKTSVAFPAASVLHFIDYDPTDATRGSGDAEASVRAIDIQHQILRYLDASLRNGGAPSGMLVVPNGVSPDEKERLEAEANDELSVENAGRIKVVDGDAKFFPNNMSPKDFEYGGLWDGMTQAICTGMGVAPPVVGLFDTATYENVRTAYIELWRGSNGVISLGEDTSDVISNLLLPRMRNVMRNTDGYRVVFDHSMIEVLQEDNIKELTLAKEIAASSFGMSFNDALNMLSMKVEQAESGNRAFIGQGLTDAETGTVYGPKKEPAATKKDLVALLKRYHEFNEKIQRT